MAREKLNFPDPPTVDRPGDRWVCGARLTEGKLRQKNEHGVCHAGPSRLGICPLADACCPRRTWASRRKMIGLSVLIVFIAAMIAFSGGEWNATVFKPGELTTAHAQILAGTLSSEKCAACHADASLSPASWFASGGNKHQSVSLTDRCLDCHHTTIDRSSARLAHNLPRETREKMQMALVSNRSAIAPRDHSGKFSPLQRSLLDQESVECSTCHREHRGSDADLNAMTDAQCQTCHSETFGSFATSHPIWTDWPYGRGGKIAFDHSTHAMKHFPSANKTGSPVEFRCLHCHPKNERNELSRAVTYEKSCQSCHDDALKLRTDQGIELFALPTIPEANAGEISNWPPAATGFYDGKVSPIAELFLRSEKEVAVAMRGIVERDFTRIRSESAEQSAAAILIASAHRNLLNEVAEKGQAALVDRAAKTGLVSPSLTNIIRSVPPQLISDTYRLWFEVSNKSTVKAAKPVPFRLASTNDELLVGDEDELLGNDDDLLSDDKDVLLGDGHDNESLSSKPKRFDPTVNLKEGGWYRDDLRLAIVYRGHGHADSVVKSTIEMMSTLPHEDPVRARLLTSAAIAACIKCHPGAAEKMGSWTSPPLVGASRSFTKFSHTPHMNIAGLTDCVHCHTVSHAHANFEPIEREACATCHTAKAAGESCTTCHRYHVTE